MLKDCPQQDLLEVNGGGGCELQSGGEDLAGRNSCIKADAEKRDEV